MLYVAFEVPVQFVNAIVDTFPAVAGVGFSRQGFPVVPPEIRGDNVPRNVGVNRDNEPGLRGTGLNQNPLRGAIE
jgi:hypothetical protein